MISTIEKVFNTLDPASALFLGILMFSALFGGKIIEIYKETIYLFDGKQKLELEKLRLEIIKLKKDLKIEGYSEKSSAEYYGNFQTTYKAPPVSTNDGKEVKHTKLYLFSRMALYVSGFLILLGIGLFFLMGAFIEFDKFIAFVTGVSDKKGGLGSVVFVFIISIMSLRLSSKFYAKFKVCIKGDGVNFPQ